MRKLLLTLFTVMLCASFYAQDEAEYQDPAYWIDLKGNTKGIPVSIVPKKDQPPVMYSAPLKFISDKNKNKKLLNIVINSIKYEFGKRDKPVVSFEGKIDLTCCRNRPVNVELYNEKDHLIQFAQTDEDGIFKLKSVNGSLLEFKNYKLKINFTKVKIIDENWDKYYATLDRSPKPSAKEIEVLRKKEMKRVKKIKRQKKRFSN